jgi:hypothetical protein
MRMLNVFMALIALSTASNAQVINGSGSGNGTGNVGLANGNGNGNGSGNVTSNSTTVVPGVSGYNRQMRANTPSVYAPGLAASGIESCIASASAGGSGAGFGITVALTTQDKGCNLRLFSRTLYAMGHRIAATQILCNDPQVAQALALEGVACQAGETAQVTARCMRYSIFGMCEEYEQVAPLPSDVKPVEPVEPAPPVRRVRKHKLLGMAGAE